MPVVLTLQLQAEKYERDVLDKRFEIARDIYNASLGKALNRYKQLKRDKRYRELLKERLKLNKEIAQYEEDKAPKKLLDQRKKVNSQLNRIRKDYKLTEYDLHELVGPMNRHFGKNMDINTAQKMATRVWKSISDVIFNGGKKVHFKKYGQLDSIEGKSNKTGIKFRANKLVWNGLEIPVKIRHNDIYAQEALKREVRYCRIVRKVVGLKYKYYLQLVLDGDPPPKKKEKYIGDEDVGIDPSLQTVALVSDTKTRLLELAPSIDKITKEIEALQRKLDRSRRAMNPNNYNEDGTVKEGIKLIWVRSKNYLKTLFKLKNLCRKRKEIRKQEHEKLADYILSIGTNIKVEKNDFRAMAKKAKETKVCKKTGKFLSKKRYGKSIGTKAPSMFFVVLNRKLGYLGKKIKYVNPWSFRASQYNHVTDEYEKKSLSQRWDEVGGHMVQRDLYSAFLIKNSKPSLEEVDRSKCVESFGDFVKNHNEEVRRISERFSKKLCSSFGIKQLALETQEKS